MSLLSASVYIELNSICGKILLMVHMIVDKCIFATQFVCVYARDGGIMRLCVRIILRIIGDLPHNYANPA